MNILTFNNEFSTSMLSTSDVLSVFKQQPEKSLTIQHGMSVKEISEIVSEKVIAVVKEQFQATKDQFRPSEAEK